MPRSQAASRSSAFVDADESEQSQTTAFKQDQLSEKHPVVSQLLHIQVQPAKRQSAVRLPDALDRFNAQRQARQISQRPCTNPSSGALPPAAVAPKMSVSTGHRLLQDADATPALDHSVARSGRMYSDKMVQHTQKPASASGALGLDRTADVSGALPSSEVRHTAGTIPGADLAQTPPGALGSSLLHGRLHSDVQSSRHGRASLASKLQHVDVDTAAEDRHRKRRYQDVEAERTDSVLSKRSRPKGPSALHITDTKLSQIPANSSVFARLGQQPSQ